MRFFIMGLLIIGLAGCDNPSSCLKDANDVGTIIGVEVTSITRYSRFGSQIYDQQMLRIKRDNDNTICLKYVIGNGYKIDDKVRGPM